MDRLHVRVPSDPVAMVQPGIGHRQARSVIAPLMSFSAMTAWRFTCRTMSTASMVAGKSRSLGKSRGPILDGLYDDLAVRLQLCLERPFF